MPTGEHIFRPQVEPHPFARATLTRKHFTDLEHARVEYTKAANEYSWLESGFEHGDRSIRNHRRACKLTTFMDRVEADIRDRVARGES